VYSKGQAFLFGFKSATVFLKLKGIRTHLFVNTEIAEIVIKETVAGRSQMLCCHAISLIWKIT
jgi:hypothetical protein